MEKAVAAKAIALEAIQLYSQEQAEYITANMAIITALCHEVITKMSDTQLKPVALHLH